MDARKVYERTYRKFRDERTGARRAMMANSMSHDFFYNRTAYKAAATSYSARDDQFTGHPPVREIQGLHFPVFQSATHFAGLRPQINAERRANQGGIS